MSVDLSSRRIIHVLTRVLSLIALSTLVNSEASLQSASLTSTGRRHPCPGELMVFTCETNGTYLDWKFDKVHRAIFFDDQPVDQVQTVSGRRFQLHSILTGNDALTGTSATRRLNSILILRLSESNTESHNITCSSDTETQVVRFRTADVPNVPRNLEVSPLNLSQESLSSLTLRWEEPENMENFDLDYYTIRLLSQTQDVVQEYTLNVTSPRLEFPFGLLLGNGESVNISVSAVSKCSQKGPRSQSLRLVVPREPVQTSTDYYSSTDPNVLMTNGFKEVNISLFLLSVAVGSVLTFLWTII